MFCPKCGAELAEDAKFCTLCGQPVGSVATAISSTFCPQCGGTFSPGETFCAKCGYRLTPSRAQPVSGPDASPVRTSTSANEMIVGGEVKGKGLRIAGGVLLLLCGVITFILGIVTAVGGGILAYYGSGVIVVFGVIGVILALVAILGGAFACAGKNYGLALAGAICEMLSPILILSLIHI